MIDNDVASHDGLAAISFRAIHALLAKTLNGLAQHVYRLCGCVTAAFFLYKFLNFAGYNQNVCHVVLHCNSVSDQTPSQIKREAICNWSWP